MRTLIYLFALIIGSVIQAILPCWTAFGHVKAPILMGLTLYYALTGEQRSAITAAFVCGLVEDAMGMVPLGYTSPAFCLGTLIVNNNRQEIYTHHPITHILCGAFTAALTIVVLATFLLLTGEIAFQALILLHKILGAALLGAITAPLTFILMRRLEKSLGVAPAEDERYVY